MLIFESLHLSLKVFFRQGFFQISLLEIKHRHNHFFALDLIVFLFIMKQKLTAEKIPGQAEIEINII